MVGEREPGPLETDAPDITDPSTEGGRPAGSPVGRRAILGMLGAGAAGIVVGSYAQSAIGEALRPLKRLDGGALTALLPGTNRFRIYSVVGHSPERSRAEWSFRVDGLVERPQRFDYADVTTGLPQVGLSRDFQCVTGWRVPEVAWRGVRVADILDRAGVGPGATHVRFLSFDGTYTESLTLDQARRDDVLVAHHMLGEAISDQHGGPVRLFVAPMYGYKSLKWLERIEVTDRLVEGYWEQRGYDTDAWVGQSNGRSDLATS